MRRLCNLPQKEPYGKSLHRLAWLRCRLAGPAHRAGGHGWGAARARAGPNEGSAGAMEKFTPLQFYGKSAASELKATNSGLGTGVKMQWPLTQNAFRLH